MATLCLAAIDDTPVPAAADGRGTGLPQAEVPRWHDQLVAEVRLHLGRLERRLTPERAIALDRPFLFDLTRTFNLLECGAAASDAQDLAALARKAGRLLRLLRGHVGPGVDLDLIVQVVALAIALIDDATMRRAGGPGRDLRAPQATLDEMLEWRIAMTLARQATRSKVGSPSRAALR